MTTFEKIYNQVARVPQGKVVTYGQVAQKLGLQNPRIVGFAMNGNRDLIRVPCHRVVKSDGTIGGYALGSSKKLKKLQNEGVSFLNRDTVNLKESLFSL